MITVLEGVSVGGILLPLIVIYKEQTHLEGWHAFVERDSTYFAYSDKGWTLHEIRLNYLIKIFELNTSKR